ncbi:MAG: tetratricopeptide repeat protein [Patescibacteria group bacterium]|nr:tetratricopeptide repeat protein [Patescibacteria group bacterium]
MLLEFIQNISLDTWYAAMLYICLFSFVLIVVLFVKKHYDVVHFRAREKQKEIRDEFLQNLKKENISSAASDLGFAHQKNIDQGSITESNRAQKENMREVNSAMRDIETQVARENYHQAESELIRVLSLVPYHKKAHERLSFIYLKQGMYSRAEAAYIDAIALDSRNASLYTNLGLAFYNQEKMKDAYDSYAYALRLDDTKINRYINLAQVQYQIGHKKEALKTFRQALKKDPKNVQLLRFVGEISQELGEKEDAIIVYRKILELEPYNEEIVLILQKIES